MPDDAFRQVRAADFERNIVSRIIDGPGERGGGEWGVGSGEATTTRLGEIGHMCAPRFSRQRRDRQQRDDEISAQRMLQDIQISCRYIL